MAISYLRMKSGLPRISAARSPGGAAVDHRARRARQGRTENLLRAAWDRPGRADPDRRPVSAARSGSAATGSAPRAKAAAKPIRCIVASGLSQASAVFLYPSGVCAAVERHAEPAHPAEQRADIVERKPGCAHRRDHEFIGRLVFLPGAVPEFGAVEQGLAAPARMSPPVARKRAARRSTSAGGGASATKYCASSKAICCAVAGLDARISSASSPSARPCATQLASEKDLGP